MVSRCKGISFFMSAFRYWFHDCVSLRDRGWLETGRWHISVYSLFPSFHKVYPNTEAR